MQGGLKNGYDITLLKSDLLKRNVQIAGLQETKCSEGFIHHSKEENLICIAEDDEKIDWRKRYGLGFYISNQMYEFYQDHKRISNRIAIIRFKIPINFEKEQQNRNKKQKKEFRCKYYKIITIINAYGPTTLLVKNNMEEREKFYQQLHETYKTYKAKSTATYIVGDMNSKLGIKKEGEYFMGKYGKGSRNNNGEQLSQFLEEHNLYAANTNFQHPMKHRSTWHGTYKITVNEEKWIQVHNQIDYIIIPQSAKPLLHNSRSYNGHIFPSDHSIVVAILKNYHIIHQSKKIKRKHKVDVDISKLIHDSKVQKEYNLALKKNLETLNSDTSKLEITKSETSISNQISTLLQIIKTSAKATIPQKQTTNNMRINYFEDLDLKHWSDQRQTLRLLISECKNNSEKSYQLRKQRNKIKRYINKKIKELKDQKIKIMLDELENTTESNRKFEINREMAISNRKSFSLTTEDGHQTTAPSKCEEILREHYSQFFNPETDKNKLDSWGEYEGPLNNPITESQVAKAQKSLRNQRACGVDGTQPELYKYDGNILTKMLTRIFNDIFIHKEHPHILGAGYLIPCNKPGKEPSIKNLRAITLLSQLRKILSLICLHRIQNEIYQFLPDSQCAYRKGRNTSEITWAYSWIKAITIRYQTEIHILGLDMSKAFDTIHREKLFMFFGNIVSESNYRIIRLLLTNTSLAIIIKDYCGKWFNTYCGSPQGDGLSPTCWGIYLEGVLKPIREIRLAIQMELKIQRSQQRIQETQYADDIDFISGLGFFEG